MSNRLGGKQGTAYLGTNAQQPPNWNFYPHDPTIYTYQNFSLGDLWLNTVTQQAFVLVSLERNTVTNEFNAIWTDFTGTPAGVVESLQAADGTVAFPVNGQIDFPNTVITGNTNQVTNILTSAQPNNGGNFLINLTPQISLRNDTNGVDSITLEHIAVSGGAWNSTLKFLRADGTIAAPTAVSNNFGLGSLRFFGYTGSGYTAAPSAGIKSLVKGVVVDNPNPALSAVPACLAFAVSETQLTEPFDLNSLDIKLQIDPDGQVYVKNGNLVVETPPAPGTALLVNGVNTNANYTLESTAAVNAGLHNAGSFSNSSVTAGSSSQVSIRTTDQALVTGGDPSLRFVNENFNSITIGLDTSLQQYAMNGGASLGGASNFFTWTIANSQINMPLQCSFGAFLQPGLANQTGAGGQPDILFNNITSNIGNAYNPANGRFTAPIDGKYLIGTNVTVDNISAAMTDGNVTFWRYNAAGVAISAYAYNYINTAAIRNPANRCSLQAHIVIPLNATDYVTVKCQLLNGAGNTAGYSGFGARETNFYGQLLS